MDFSDLATPQRTVCFYETSEQVETVGVKMAAPTEFTLESVRDFMLDRGGKVTNHELVKYFKPFLTDPYTKGNLSIRGRAPTCCMFTLT